MFVKEYLETFKSDIQSRDRFWKVIEDTTSINVSYQLGEKLGSFGAVAAVNKMANNSMDEMVSTTFTLTKSEKLNEKIYQQFARD